MKALEVGDVLILQRLGLGALSEQTAEMDIPRLGLIESTKALDGTYVIRIGGNDHFALIHPDKHISTNGFWQVVDNLGPLEYTVLPEAVSAKQHMTNLILIMADDIRNMQDRLSLMTETLVTLRGSIK